MGWVSCLGVMAVGAAPQHPQARTEAAAAVGWASRVFQATGAMAAPCADTDRPRPSCWRRRRLVGDARRRDASPVVVYKYIFLNRVTELRCLPPCGQGRTAVFM